MKYECRKCVGENTGSEGNCILDVGTTEDIPCVCPYGQPFFRWKKIGNELNREIKMKQITIYLKDRVKIVFNGKYRRDLEKPNWHYYEDENGTMHHIRKKNMILVIEREIKNGK